MQKTFTIGPRSIACIVGAGLLLSITARSDDAADGASVHQEEEEEPVPDPRDHGEPYVAPTHDLAVVPSSTSSRNDAREEALANRGMRRRDHDARAERRSPTPAQELTAVTQEEAAIAAGCVAGTVFWHRSQGIELCAPRCESDLQCVEGERCRILSPDLAAADSILLADVVDAERAELDADNALNGVDVVDAPDAEAESQEVRVCDPLWDLEGAASAGEDE